MSKPSVSLSALLTRIAVVGLGLALFLDRARSHQLTPVWIGLLAPAFFLMALWAASNALVRMDRGDDFGPAMVRGLKEIGGALMLGAFAAIVVQPSLIVLIGNGFTEMRGVRFDLDVENLTLVIVGLVLVVLARHGQKLKSKLDEFV